MKSRAIQLPSPGKVDDVVVVEEDEVAAAYEAYRIGDNVVAALESIAKQRKEEFTYLEDLYRRKSGANDRLFPKEYAEEWRRLIPGATAVIVPECGHIPHVEKPAAFVSAFEGFIDGKRLAA